MRTITRWIVPVLACVLLAACDRDAPQALQFEQQLVTARTVSVEPGGWVRNFKSFGVVTDAFEHRIVPAIGGVVAQVRFREGQAVAAGEELLRLDDAELRSALALAEQSLKSARAGLQEAVDRHQRNEGRYKHGDITRQQYQQGKAARRAAADTLREALANFHRAGAALAAAVLRSPVDGMVVSREVEPGQQVAAGEVLGVVKLERGLRVATVVSARDVNFLRPGAPASITSPGVPGQVFSGRIDSVASAAEAATGNFPVGVLVEDPGELLRKGMSAMVEFSGAPEEGVLAIPRAALVDRGRRLIVYRVEDNIAREVEPILGVGDADTVPVLGGLAVGDEIVVSNLRLVTDGQLIGRAGK